MLAHTRGHDRLRTADDSEALDHVLGREGAIIGKVIAEGIGVAPAVQLRPPGFIVTHATRCHLFTYGRDQLGDDLADIPHDRHIGVTVL